MAEPRSAPLHLRSSYADVNGLSLYYEVYGEGMPLVLIHGGGSTIQTTFGRIIPELSKTRQLVAVELQGHGHTAGREGPETFEQDADDVAGLLDSLDIEVADFFGFSNGGNAVMQIALSHPALVRKIILGSTLTRRDGISPRFWESLERATVLDMPPLLKEAFSSINADPRALIAMFEKDKQRMTGFTDMKAEDIRSIKASVLIISGDKDIIRPEHAVEMYRLFPHCRLAIIPGGHGGYLGEIETLRVDNNSTTAFVASLIDRFLDTP